VRAFSFFNALESKQEVISRLQVVSNLAKDYGLIFCHENEKDIYGDELSRVLEIATEVENLKLVYDPANYLQCNQNATECLQKTLTFTEYFHIKDVILKTGEIVPAGYGDGDISGLINAVKNRNAVLTLEPHLKVFEGYGDIDSTEMKNRFEFKTNREAFDFAVSSLKKIIISCGYKEEKGEFTL
jgi:sugar phosphate isomerase/epimerase